MTDLVNVVIELSLTRRRNYLNSIFLNHTMQEVDHIKEHNKSESTLKDSVGENLRLEL